MQNVTGNEQWIIYNNVERKRLWNRQSEFLFDKIWKEFFVFDQTIPEIILKYAALVFTSYIFDAILMLLH